MRFYGVDPGKSGGVAWVDTAGDAWAAPMPWGGDGPDGGALHRIIQEGNLLHHVGGCIIEKVHAHPGQGVVSMFSFGRAFQVCLDAAAIAGVPSRLVTPPAWKAMVLKGTDHSKDAAIGFCRRLFPSVPLILPRCRTPHDGMADALCLAYFGVLSSLRKPS